MVYGRAESRKLSLPWCLPLKLFFNSRLSFLKDCLSSNVVYANIRLQLKVNYDHHPKDFVLHVRSSSIEGCLPSNVVFNSRVSSIKFHLPSKVLFNLKVSSTEGPLPSKVVLHPVKNDTINLLSLKFIQNFDCPKL